MGSKTGATISLLRLMRLPNVFTAIADVLMGFIFIHQSFDPMGGLILLVLSTICFYSAGMILNDVFDIEVDSKERPERPIPAGDFPLKTAAIWGTSLLVIGFVLASLSYLMFGDKVAPLGVGFEPSLISLLLIITILLYNKILKKTSLAPVLMGSCRFLNILLGMSLAAAQHRELLPAGMMIASGIGVFIAGVTWFARSESKESDRRLLIWGFAIMVTGLFGIISTPWCGLDLPATVEQNKPYLLPFMIGMIGLSIGRLALAAIADPIPQRVQMTIKQCILSLILIHAAICLWVNPSNVQLPLMVVILIFPAILLGRWFKST
ncbi:MAG: UbiA family prenyltransferase [Planctomycetota bacterium]|nr:UbiA family prenyltransferase [Planctomycetota bacterium]